MLFLNFFNPFIPEATSSRSRQFSSKPVGAVDSTEWTETPADKERKSKETRSEKRKAEEPLPYSASDMQRKKVIEEYNVKREIVCVHRRILFSF